MGVILNGLKPKSKKGKSFQMNNVGWGVMIGVLFGCSVDEDIVCEMEDLERSPQIDSEDSIIIADALDLNGCDVLNKQTKEYEPLVKEFAEFCRVSGGFEVF